LQLKNLSVLNLISSEKDFLFSEAIKDKKILNLILLDLQFQAKKFKLSKFEIVKKIYLVNDEWTPDNGCLTSSFKLRRGNVYEKYEKIIKNLFDNKF
jgi:long-chain acyl-CoA synthetase